MKTPVESMIDSVLQPTGKTGHVDGLPVLTHRGVLRIGDVELECGRLSDGRTIFFGEGAAGFLHGLVAMTEEMTANAPDAQQASEGK